MDDDDEIKTLEIRVYPEDVKRLKQMLDESSARGVRYTYDEMATFVFREGLLHYKPFPNTKK